MIYVEHAHAIRTPNGPDLSLLYMTRTIYYNRQISSHG